MLGLGVLGDSTDRFQYAYDRAGNVLYKDNLVISSLSELYHANSTATGDNNTAYDGLSRLVAFTRGTLSVDSSHHNGISGLGSLDKVTTASSLSDHSDTYTLSAVGDQTSTTQDGTGTTNTVNSQNELIANGSNTLVYDNNGNTTTDQAGNTYIYDAWNHAVTVKNSGGTTIAAYAYDADGRRISQTESGTTTSLYLDAANGNVIEERQSGTVVAQEVWGEAYTNELILRDDNSTSGSLGKSGSGLGRRLYYQYDADFNITAVISISGSILQRMIYDPNGNVKFLTSSGTATTDGYATAYGFQGGRRDMITGFVFFNATGSGRDYNPVTGTWEEPDNAGYVNGVDYYEMEERNSPRFRDFTGNGFDSSVSFDLPAQNTPTIPTVTPDSTSVMAAVLQSLLDDTTPKSRAYPTEPPTISEAQYAEMGAAYENSFGNSLATLPAAIPTTAPIAAPATATATAPAVKIAALVKRSLSSSSRATSSGLTAVQGIWVITVTDQFGRPLAGVRVDEKISYIGSYGTLVLPPTTGFGTTNVDGQISDPWRIWFYLTGGSVLVQQTVLVGGQEATWTGVLHEDGVVNGVTSASFRPTPPPPPPPPPSPRTPYYSIPGL